MRLGEGKIVRCLFHLRHYANGKGLIFNVQQMRGEIYKLVGGVGGRRGCAIRTELWKYAFCIR